MRWFNERLYVLWSDEEEVRLPQKHPRYVKNSQGRPIFCCRSPELLMFYLFSDDYSRYVGWAEIGGVAWDLADRPTRLELANMALRKLAEQAADPSTPEWVDTNFQKRFPLLFEHLTLAKWEEDGSDRATSTLTLFLGPQGPSCSLKERNANRTLFASSESFLGLFDAIERVLADTKAVWRADKASTGSSARIKKR